MSSSPSTVLPGHPSWRQRPPADVIQLAGVDVEPPQVVAVLVAALAAQQLDLTQADGVLAVTGLAQHLPDATRRGLLLDAVQWHGMAEDLAAGAYQVVATLDPTPRPDGALLAASGSYATDQRDWCITALTRQA